MSEETEKQELIEKNRKLLAHFPAFGKFLLIYAGNFIIPEIFNILSIIDIYNLLLSFRSRLLPAPFLLSLSFP